ncbi:Nitrilase and fragile histidine triad fusion protein NitFhit [Tolypocladium ophioglossoides CBS 100239]|uniref:Nitrilase and fragile histidine triad fusion protein NitFhit n=1 Tax=Tolypocladium ophioglossoides (strain CBS 100239) TaxID=1163406 RepID=A0A0L0NGA1_TOLOC|nr:Nitrilase and fragile histidine triad fusion protein NitFhit [Tolypocladium ophioglossoides CBS 100239]
MARRLSALCAPNFSLLETRALPRLPLSIAVSPGLSCDKTWDRTRAIAIVTQFRAPADLTNASSEPADLDRIRRTTFCRASQPPISLRLSPARRKETTRLLGAGAQEDGDGVGEGNGAGANGRKDGWNGFDDFEGLPWWRTPSVFWLLAPFAIFTLAFGGIIVPKLNLILDLVCQQYFADRTLIDPKHPIVLGSDNPQCRIPGVQKDVAAFILVLNFVTGGLSAIVAPKLGHMSDRFGRTKLLALASCGGILGEMLTILAAKFPQTINYRWLVLGAVFDGVTGSFTAGNILCQSYTSDCTPPSKRAVSIGYIYACLFTGLAFGPLLAAYFVKWTGSLLSIFYVVLGCHAFFMLFVGFVVPESVSKRKQVAAREKWQKEKEARATHVGPWASMVHSSNPFAPLRILWPTGPGTSTRLRMNLVALAVCDAIVFGGSFAAGPVVILYSGYMFDWGNFETSRFVSALSMVRVVVLMGVLPIVNYFGRVRPAARRRELWGVNPEDKNSGADHLDTWILRVALVSDILGCLGYVFARSEALFFGSGMITALGGLGSATTQAAVTKHVPQERVGQILGAIGMLQALARVVGPVIFNGIYAATVETFPQAIFVALGGLFVIAFLTSLVIKPHICQRPGSPIRAVFEPRRGRMLAVRLGRAMTRSFATPPAVRGIMTSTSTEGKALKFGPFEVTDQVFLTTRHSFALVNLKPIIQGHIFVCPSTPHLRLTDLSADETADLFRTVQLTQRLLARAYFTPTGDLGAGSFTIAVQDGAEAGQTVPHVHVHVIPRTRGDFGDGGAMDDIYVKMAGEEGNVGGALWDRERRPAPGGGMPRIEDVERHVRTPAQMHEEAARYKVTLREMGVE